MAEFYTILTKIGLAKFANAQLSSIPVNITHLAVGDGNGSAYNPTQDATTLKNEKWRGAVNSISLDEVNPNWIVIEVAVPADIGGWMIREAGLFDNTGNMLAIAKYPETYKPIASSGSTKDLVIKMIIEVNNPSSVELKLDPTIITASRDYVNKNVASAEARVNQQLAESEQKLNTYFLNVKHPPAQLNPLKGDGVDESVNVQALVNYLESKGGGVLYFPSGNYKFTNIKSTRPINFKGEHVSLVKFTNAGTGRMISYDYFNTGISDTNKRNWVVIEDITFEDSTSYTGSGVYAYHITFLEFRNCFFKEFRNGFGADIEEGLWIYFNNCNTDKSHIRIHSNKNPHNSNIVAFNGGEYRNAVSYAISISNGDVVSLNDTCIEGKFGTEVLSGLLLDRVRFCDVKNVYIEHIEGASRGAIYTKDCIAISINHSLITTNDTNPAIYTVGTNNLEVEKSYLNGIYADDTNGHITFEKCEFYGKVDIAEGVYYLINNPKPASTTTIPINPKYQKEKNQGDLIPYSNRYVDSSFRTGIPTVIQSVGTPTAIHDTTVGWYDSNSLSINGVANDRALIDGLGRIDLLGQGAIISFMAKAEVEADFEFSPAIAVASGNTLARVKTEWRRFFVVSLLQDTQTALATVKMWVKFFSSNKIWIDDVQVIPFSSYNETTELIDNFRYIPTHGTVIVNDKKAVHSYVPYFDKGIQFRKYSYAPQNPQEGMVYFADGVSWNPNSGGKGLYFYDGSTYTKL